MGIAQNIDPPGNQPAKASGYIPAKTGTYRWFVVFVMGAVFALMTIDRQVMPVLQVPIQHELKLSDTQLGLLTGLAYALFYAIMALPLARIAERVNRVGMVSVCIAVWSLMTSFSGLSANFLMLFLARMGVGFGEAGCYPVSASLIADYFEKETRPFALALYSIGLSVGGMAGPALGGILSYYYGWREAFLILGIGGLIAAPLVSFLVRDPQRGAMDEDSALTLRKKPPSFFRCLYIFWRTPSYRYLVIAIGVHTLVMGGLQVWVAPYLFRMFHVSLAQLGVFVGLLMGGGGILGNLLAGYLVGKLGRTDPRWYAFVPAIACAFLIPVALYEFTVPSLTLAIGAGVAAVFLMSVFAPPTVALTQSLLVPQMRTTAASITLLTTSLMSSFGPLVVGLASDRLVRHGFNNAQSLRWGVMSLTLLEVVAIGAYFLCAANLRADFSRDRSGDAGEPDAAG